MCGPKLSGWVLLGTWHGGDTNIPTDRQTHRNTDTWRLQPIDI